MPKYSIINYPALRVYKKLVKTKEGQELLSSQISSALHSIPSAEDQFFAIDELGLFKLLANNEFLHYYITSKELSDFFISTHVKEDSLQDILSVVSMYATTSWKDAEITQLKEINKGRYKNQEKEGEKEYESEVVTGIKFFTGCIHCKSMTRSVFFNFQQTENLCNLFLSNGDDVSRLPLTGDKHLRSNVDLNNSWGNLLRLVINMTYYMKAFPDHVVNVPPDEMCDKLNIGNSRSVSLAGDIEQYLKESRDVSPHLRRGHFKYLGSDFYTRKRGQVIFVKSSFVKGQARSIV